MHVLLIGHPVEQLTGARLPSGRDVMQNFVLRVVHSPCINMDCNVRLVSVTRDFANRELIAFLRSIAHNISM